MRGGNTKFRALRLDQGNFSWGSEGEDLEVGIFTIYSVFNVLLKKVIISPRKGGTKFCLYLGSSS